MYYVCPFCFSWHLAFLPFLVLHQNHADFCTFLPSPESRSICWSSLYLCIMCFQIITVLLMKMIKEIPVQRWGTAATSTCDTVVARSPIPSKGRDCISIWCMSINVVLLILKQCTHFIIHAHNTCKKVLFINKRHMTHSALIFPIKMQAPSPVQSTKTTQKCVQIHFVPHDMPYNIALLGSEIVRVQQTKPDVRPYAC